MRRLSLGTLLTTVNVGLVAAAVLCLVAAATGLLRRLTDEQALARGSLAAATAVHAIEGSLQNLPVSARLLAERPALPALLERRDTAAIQEALGRYRRSDGLSGCGRPGRGALLGPGRRLSSGKVRRFCLRRV